jgi:hypothetical protein
MKNTTQWFIFLLAVFIASANQNIFTQNKTLPITPVYFSGSNGDANNPMPLTTMPEALQKSELEQQLEAQLDAARSSNNTIAAQQIQAELNKHKGHLPVFHTNMSLPGVNFGEGESEGDYNQALVHTLSVYSHAFAVAPAGSPEAGRLFYMLSQDSQSGADSLKLMHSTNNGATWSSVFWASMTGFLFNKDEMDIEVVFDGTATWLFGVVGIIDQSDNRKKICFFRYNVTGSGYYWTLLNFPGSGPNMHYYNPRITSDNTNFTSSAYVMMICSMDSLVSGTPYVKQKYVYSSLPFGATPNLNYTQPNGTNGFGWAGTSLTGGYLYSDIAYYKDDGGTGQNRVMTVYSSYGSGINNIYIAYLNGYSTLGNTMFISEPGVNKNVKIAFNGGANNRNGMITYVRRFSSTDWDIFGFRTTNGGNAPASWTRDTIDYTGDYARNCDLIAVRNAVNQFKIAYGQDNANFQSAYYRTFEGSSWSQRFQVNTTNADTVYAKPRAAYLLGGGDNGAVVWSGFNGFNGFFSKQIMSTTGIQNTNEIPSGFSLSQNYPNPFNPVTNIKFSVPQPGAVSLIVFDIAGKEVAKLVNQDMNSGTYSFDFNASHLSSGVYFYRLSAGSFTDVKKMILVK